MKKSKEWINCDRTDCFTNREGKCPVLYDNDFRGKPCPFFKTELQIKEEEVYCLKRLKDKYEK